ncbi:MAG: penicillin-binding transpeptidase domain-containing protein, partial [Chitinivibrionales bacterium]
TRVTMAMGQEVMSTFLQMVNSFTVICGDGVLRKPIICKEVVSNSNESILKGNSRPVRQVISENVALKLRRILRGVVEEGTGTRALLPGLDIGGKTGTSQKVDPETGGYSESDVWSSFIGFVPVEEVGLICGVLIDQPEEAEPGGIAAAPAFKSIVRRIVSMPELAYSDKILEYDHRKETDNAVVEHLPDFREMSRNNAVKLLQHQEVPYEFIGMGDTVRYQIPFGGNSLNKGAHLTLYTDPELEDNGLNEEKDLVRIPNCIGKDLCDVINALNVKGIKPVISGAGIVKKQSPAVGVMVRRASVCTLYCAGLTDRFN